MNLPLRMCVVCRQMKQKDELYRVCLNNGEVVFDKTNKAQGRGAYICKTGGCIEKMDKTRAFDRAFKRNVSHYINEKTMKEMIE